MNNRFNIGERVDSVDNHLIDFSVLSICAYPDWDLSQNKIVSFRYDLHIDTVSNGIPVIKDVSEDRLKRHE